MRSFKHLSRVFGFLMVLFALVVLMASGPTYHVWAAGFSETYCGSPVTPAPVKPVVLPPHDSPMTVEISIYEVAFNPPVVTINVGDTVRWTNNDFITHTTTSDAGVWNSGNLGFGQTFSFTFNSPGEFDYHCNIHSTMTGLITVLGAATPTPSPTPSPSPTPVRTAFDFDFDGRADVSVFRPSDGNWYLLRSSAGFTAAPWGITSDKIVPADYDGDGKTDIAVYRPSQGTWYILRSSNGTFFAVSFGIAEDLPSPGDFDHDGSADLAVFRPSTGTWWISPSTGGLLSAQFGTSTDKPLVGDWNGDGRADLGVFRPSNSTWYTSTDLVDPSHNFRAITFGLSTDLITPADFDGDHQTDIAVFRPSNGVWFWLNSANNNAFSAVQFGISEDIPAAADFDGDGRADITVFRPSSGIWYRLNLSTGELSGVQFGATGDSPIPAAFRY